MAQQDVQHRKTCMTLLDIDCHIARILQQVDGSITVKRENGCLSTATSFTWVSMWAEPAALPSGRGYGTTCAKVWNVDTIAFL